MVVCAASASVALSAPPDQPTRTQGSAVTQPQLALAGMPQPPRVRAKAWAVIDGVDGQLLAGNKVEQARPVASLTKLMTALIVAERTQGDEMVRISRAAERVGDGSEIGVRTGQRYSVDTLLGAMLAHSANDAAVALAEYVGNSEAEFIELMNEKADELELGSATFTSVTGLDATPLTKASVTDIVELARVALKDPRIRAAVKLRSVTVARPGTSAVTLPNRNRLLRSYDGIDGVKTGFTDAAGHCLLVHWSAAATSDGIGGDIADAPAPRASTPAPTAAEIAAGTDDAPVAKPAKSNELWVIVVGEPADPARFTDTAALLDWARPMRQRLRIAAAGDAVGSVPVQGSDRRVRVYAAEDVWADLRIGNQVTERISTSSQLVPPLRKGNNVGRYEVLVGDTVVASTELYVNEQVQEESVRERLQRYARSWDDAAREGWDTVTDQLHDAAKYWGLA
jgi:D-alanyl-D-alanine carboxypeptidase (penicillin-binding protein 5/6)